MKFQELMDCYYLSDEDDNRVVYDQLLKMMKKQNVTPVIGAGLSCWAYPLWGALLKKYAKVYGIEDQVDKLLAENQYEEAASCLEEEVTHNKFMRLLEKSFSESKIEEKASEMPEYLRKIPRLFRGSVVTTNFDRVIEYLYQTEGKILPDTVNPSDDFQSDKIERALHQNTPLLVKMHGDINDSKHLVLTREAYDRAYGENPQEPDFERRMPRFLQKILQRNPLLFLGCSLEADRTCSVIKKCADNIQQFAFLELPADTENKEDWLHPLLREGGGKEGRLGEGLRKRIQQITGKMNIQPIWYPHGKHTEALEAFFSQLMEDMSGGGNGNGPSSGILPEASGNYFALHKLLGRDEEVSKIVTALTENQPCCVWVEGAPGIGKTETCKEVYHRIKRSYPGKSWMPFIDITGVKTLADFWDTVARSVGADLPDDLPAEKYPEYLTDQLKAMSDVFSAESDAVRILYFDNWEDIWYGVTKNEEEKTILLKWMRSVGIVGFRILVSTRETAPSVLNDREIHLRPLDKGNLNAERISGDEFCNLDSVRLFCSILDRGITPAEAEDFRQLILQLEGHPLAIVLTATQAKREIGIKDVLARWDQAVQESAIAENRHKSLEIALRVSWESVKENEGAVLIWGLLYYSVKEIPVSVFERLRGDFEEEKWREGVSALIDANLINISQDRTRVSMLLPLKKQFRKFVPEENPIHRECLVKWAECINGLLETAENRKSEERLRAHQIIVEMMPQISHIITLIISQGEASGLTQYLDEIVRNGRNYYRNYLYRIDIMEKMLHFYGGHENEKAGILALLHAISGDLLRRLGRVKEAEEKYAGAEELYKKEKDDLGLANTLQSQGDLLSRLRRVKEAEEKYAGAEELYKKEKNDLGLANTLQSQGDLLRRLGRVKEAEEKYAGAEELYKEEKEDLGLANTLKSQGNLLSRLGRVKEAEEKYAGAEELYKKEKDDLGLANTLKSQGDLLKSQGRIKAAIEQYVMAVGLYEKEKALVGYLYSIAELYECYKKEGAESQAEKVKQLILDNIDRVPYEEVKEYVKEKLDMD